MLKDISIIYQNNSGEKNTNTKQIKGGGTGKETLKLTQVSEKILVRMH